MDPLAVTTSGKPAPSEIDAARAFAAAWKLPLLPRGGGALAPLFERAEALLVLGADGPRLVDRAGSVRFHLGMAHLRRLRVDAGEGDSLVRAAGLVAGDRVLDATLGLAQDALVAARAVGRRGRVVGLEASLPIAALVAAGLARLPDDPSSCAIEVRHAEAAAALPALADGAFDVVVLDPMFDRPARAQPGFEVLRRHAVHAPLEPALLDEARRVAARCVVVKGPRHSALWRRIGARPLAGSPYSKVVWARLPSLREPVGTPW